MRACLFVEKQSTACIWLIKKGFVNRLSPGAKRRGYLSMYAIIKTGGKQYRVAEGEFLKVETIDAEEGAEVVLNEVLHVSTEEGPKVGPPLL